MNRRGVSLIAAGVYALGIIVVIAISVVTINTWRKLQPMSTLDTVAVAANKPTLLDRNGKKLNFTLAPGWNVNDQLPLHQIPSLMQNAFIYSEDKRFYSHHGTDWLARLHAVLQAMPSFKFKRGASTISEQVVRMIHPRPRTLWSKWLEGLEARQLENDQKKLEILEFYFNQLPYGSEQRGLKQAAYFYFGRDLDTLSTKEMLALVVLARAPSLFSRAKYSSLLDARIFQLAERLADNSLLSLDQIDQMKHETLQFSMKPESSANAFHFANYVWKQEYNDNKNNNATQITTTLDAELQRNIKQLLDARIEQLADKNVQNGAVLVADHTNHEILAWVVSGHLKQNTPGAFIDAVTTPRQPGSTLKPFIYTMALEKGWTAATQIKDEPLQTAVGRGLHSYKNYSHQFYGELTVREALANSLNIPAVKTLEFVGNGFAIERLRAMGMDDLTKNPSIYGDGLALGNGEISLLELVQAYTVLANRGVYVPLQTVRSRQRVFPEKTIFSAESTSIISNILADNHARQLEFGNGNSLVFAVETAAKTGTSTDHCDAWIVAYNYRYIVGIWLGNLNRQPMRDVTGSTGPALLAHTIFSRLNKNQETKPLFLSPKLTKQTICAGFSNEKKCLQRDEWFVAGTEPVNFTQPQLPANKNLALEIQKPSDGLNLAMDPRIPDQLEAFEFSLNQQQGIQTVNWRLDGDVIAQTSNGKYLWALSRGAHTLLANITNDNGSTVATHPVTFYVK